MEESLGLEPPPQSAQNRGILAENQLKIRVYDNGPAFPDGPLSGFGIQNTQERIALLYGAKATINWQNGAEKYVEISIPV